jgi:hypothetical protein
MVEPCGTALSTGGIESEKRPAGTHRRRNFASVDSKFQPIAVIEEVVKGGGEAYVIKSLTAPEARTAVEVDNPEILDQE